MSELDRLRALQALSDYTPRSAPGRALAQAYLEMQRERDELAKALAWTESTRGICVALRRLAGGFDGVGRASEGNVLRDAASLLDELTDLEDV